MIKLDEQKDAVSVLDTLVNTYENWELKQKRRQMYRMPNYEELGLEVYEIYKVAKKLKKQ